MLKKQFLLIGLLFSSFYISTSQINQEENASPLLFEEKERFFAVRDEDFFIEVESNDDPTEGEILDEDTIMENEYGKQ